MATTAIYQRIHNSFQRAGLLKTIGARLIRAEEGLVEVELPYSPAITQQQGGFHGGVIGTLADTTGGYASLTVAPPDSEVMTVEYKINFLNNFQGGTLRGIGKVIKKGQRIIVTTADIFHVNEEGKSTLCAVMQQTLVPIKKTY